MIDIAAPSLPGLDLKVLDGFEMQGQLNVADPVLLANVAHSIRRQHPQVQPFQVKAERVLLVGGGPSLASSIDELAELHFAGAMIVAVNGAAQWCLDHHLRPSCQVIVDARPGNARFVTRPVPRMKYLLASQCHADVWDAVEGREGVWIWHPIDGADTTVPLLDGYYGAGRWFGVPGGTTVAMRALRLLRALGYTRIDLFGVDSCFLDDAHHAYPQPENDADRRAEIGFFPTGLPNRKRSFVCAPWHIKQLEDFLQTIRVAGDDFLLQVHGDGLLAFALREASADHALIWDSVKE